MKNRTEPFRIVTWFRDNSRLAAFAVCFFIAAGIWTINSLNQVQHSTFIVDIKYDKLWLRSFKPGQNPEKIRMDIRGRGFDLMRFYFSNPKDFIEIGEEGLFTGRSSIASAELVHNLFRDYHTRIKIERINPEIITLPGKRPFYRKVALKPNYDIQLDPMYLISGPAVCQPDSIWISSADTLPVSLKSIYTTSLKKKDVNAPVFGSVAPDLSRYQNIIPETDKIWIYIPVEQGTESVITVSLIPEIRNANNIRLVPSAVEVKSTVPLSRYEETQAGKFRLKAVASGTGTDKAIVKLEKAPFWAKNISWSPVTVDYFIQSSR